MFWFVEASAVIKTGRETAAGSGATKLSMYKCILHFSSMGYHQKHFWWQKHKSQIYSYQIFFISKHRPQCSQWVSTWFCYSCLGSKILKNASAPNKRSVLEGWKTVESASWISFGKFQCWYWIFSDGKLFVMHGSTKHVKFVWNVLAIDCSSMFILSFISDITLFMPWMGTGFLYLGKRSTKSSVIKFDCETESSNALHFCKFPVEPPLLILQ